MNGAGLSQPLPIKCSWVVGLRVAFSMVIRLQTSRPHPLCTSSRGHGRPASVCVCDRVTGLPQILNVGKDP